MRRPARPGYGLLLVASVASTAGPSGCGADDKAPGEAKVRPPVFAETVNLKPVTGKVSIELPAASTFTALSSERQVPVGTAVDAGAGVVRLTAATGTPAHFDGGNFQAGVFEI